MIRVLHLSRVGCDFQTRRLIDQLSTHSGSGVRVTWYTLGRGGDFRNAVHAARVLKRLRFDVIHAFGADLLLAAAVAKSVPIVFSPDHQTGLNALRWLRAASSYRDIHFAWPTATWQRLAVERGLPLDRNHIIRPGVDFSLIPKREESAALRQSLGILPEERVILAPGESTRPANHEQAVWVASILHTLDKRYRLLLWGRGARTHAAVTLARRLHQPNLIVLAEQKLKRLIDLEAILPAADLALLTAKGLVSTLPIAITMAARVPIVSTVTYTVSELLEDRHTALMVAKPAPRLLTQRVIDLAKDDNLRWQITDKARSEAFEFFSVQEMVEQYHNLYEQAAGISLSAPTPRLMQV